MCNRENEIRNYRIYIHWVNFYKHVIVVKEVLMLELYLGHMSPRILQTPGGGSGL